MGVNITKEELEVYEAMKASNMTPTMLAKSQLRINQSTSIDCAVICGYIQQGDAVELLPTALILNEALLNRLSSPEGFDTFVPQELKGKKLIINPNEIKEDPNRKIILLNGDE